MARQKKAKRQPSAAARAIPSEAAVEAASVSASARQQRREKGVARSEAKKRERAILIGVLAVTALAYFNALNGGFVYDDQFQILKNPSLDSLANIPKMFVQSVWQFMNASSGNPVGLYYRPVFNSALILGSQLFGKNAFGWHLFSLLLH